MALMPRKYKYRKHMRGKIRGNAARGNYVSYGDYGLQSMEPYRITDRQIEACRLACSHYLSGLGKLYIRIFPHKPVTATAAETRMGKGKGDISYWAACVKPGTILFELDGVTEDAAREVFRRQAHKLPCRVRMVKRETLR